MDQLFLINQNFKTPNHFLFIIALLNLLFLIKQQQKQQWNIQKNMKSILLKLKNLSNQNFLFLLRIIYGQEDIQKIELRKGKMSKNQIKLYQNIFHKVLIKKLSIIDYVYIQKPEISDQNNKTSQQRMISFQQFPDL
ncbi:unnamed protein product [Paramecium sonneborni]|uniref:Transmembrane protein n=1 Tax=Paramecium sonneborni TaxID=65129 RepID=A0A8S1QL36_9CILI|nr:unnamed protein product [Paramecium sonneborni]